MKCGSKLFFSSYSSKYKIEIKQSWQILKLKMFKYSYKKYNLGNEFVCEHFQIKAKQYFKKF